MWLNFLSDVAERDGIADIVVRLGVGERIGSSVITNRKRVPLDLPAAVGKGDFAEMLRLISPKALQVLEDPACFVYEGRLELRRRRARVSVTRNYVGVEAVMRVLPESIPLPDDLLLPPTVVDSFRHLREGLVLVVGATGMGKSTTIASLINLRAKERAERYLTIEDPIEFVYPTDGISEFTQREVGLHCLDYPTALREALRMAPHVIVVGEIRDSETAEVAMRAAQTGHLVVSTMHTHSCGLVCPRLVGFFPPDKQGAARHEFADVFKLGIAQKLIPNPEGRLVAIHEVMVGTNSLCETLRQGDDNMVTGLIETGMSDGMQSYDHARRERVAQGYLTTHNLHNDV